MDYFGEYLKEIEVPEYADKYIQYDDLKQILDETHSNQASEIEPFYRKLEFSYIGTPIILL